MNDFQIGYSPRALLSHLALYGLAGICEAAGLRDIRIGWTNGMQPRPVLQSALSADEIAGVVLQHVKDHTANGAWPMLDLPDAPGRGLMSPRIAAIRAADDWKALQSERHRVLDELTQHHQEADLSLLGALGEPSSWHVNARGEMLQDSAASRLEMQPRNTGSEFIGSRLRKVALSLASGSVRDVRCGLDGTAMRSFEGKADARGAANLDALGPTDDALVWCALWGFGATTIAHQATRRLNQTTPRSVTGICVRDAQRQEYFFAPLWRGRWHPARLRSLLAGADLSAVARAAVGRSTDEAAAMQSRDKLAPRGVTALILFPVSIHGSASAPERRAGQGRLHPIGGGAR